MYHEMVKFITAATTVIDHVPTAASEIDRVLNTMMKESRPVYIGLSVDMAYEMISANPLEMPIVRSLPLNDPELEAKVVSKIRGGLGNATNPVLILDGGVLPRFVPLRQG
jgi:pyruvate decarboxylase